MSIILLQVFVSLMLVAGSLVLFIWTVRSRTFDHADRLSLAPLEEDEDPRQHQKNRKD
jgi:cbb3-type cytochrome oxidase maturation protein